MEACEAVAKEWGNSLGIIIPKTILEKEGIKKGERLSVFIGKARRPQKSTFGIFKGRGLSGQECKDWARAELYND